MASRNPEVSEEAVEAVMEVNFGPVAGEERERWEVVEAELRAKEDELQEAASVAEDDAAAYQRTRDQRDRLGRELAAANAALDSARAEERGEFTARLIVEAAKRPKIDMEELGCLLAILDSPASTEPAEVTDSGGGEGVSILLNGVRRIAETDWTEPPTLLPDEMARATLDEYEAATDTAALTRPSLESESEGSEPKRLTLGEKAEAETEGAAAGQCPFCEGGMNSFGGVHAKDCPMLQPPVTKPPSKEGGDQHRG